MARAFQPPGLAWQQVPMKFGASQDEGVHPFALPQPLLQSLRNGRVYKDGYVKKRPGWVETAAPGALTQVVRAGAELYTVVPSIQATDPPRALCVVNQDTTRCDEQSGPGGSRSLPEVSVLGRDTVWRDQSHEGFGSLIRPKPDHAVGGPDANFAGTADFRVVAWQGRIGSNTGIYAVVLDVDTGEPLVAPQFISGSGDCTDPRVLAWGTDVGVIYARYATNEIFAVRFDGTTRTWGAPVLQIGDLHSSGTWDACSDYAGAQWWLAYRNTTPNLAIQQRTSTGSLTSTQIVAEDPTTCIAIFAHVAQGKVWVAYNVAATGLRVLARSSVTLATVVLAPTTVEGVAPNYSVTITSIDDTGTVALVWTTSGSATIAAFNYGRQLTKCVSVTSAGVIGGQITRASFSLTSRAWRATNGSIYVNVLYNASDEDATKALGRRSDGFTTAFTMCLGHATDIHSGTAQTTFRPCATWSPGTAGILRIDRLSSVVYLADTDALYGQDEYSFALSSEFDQAVENGRIIGAFGVDICRAGINADNYIPASVAMVGPNTVFSGGLPYVWDGVAISEYGILVPPENSRGLTLGAASGALSAGQYAAQIIFEYRHATGDVVRSAPSLLRPDSGTADPVITGVVGTDAIDVKVAGLSLTAKYNDTSTTLSNTMGVLIKAYRTEQAGSVYYRENDPDAGSSGISLNHPFQLTTESFLIREPDADVIARELLYTTDGILPNYPLPATAFIVSHGNRIFGISAEDRRQLVFTHTYDPGELPCWHPDLVVLLEDEAVALASLDEKLLILCKNGLYVLAGDGPDRKGLNNTFNGPDRLNGPHGCISDRSVVQIPNGVIYRAKAGMMICDRGFNITRIGGPVEDTLARFDRTLCSVAYPEREWAYWSVYAIETVAGNDGFVTQYVYRTVCFDWRHNVWSVDDENAPDEDGGSANCGMLSLAIHPTSGLVYGTNTADSGLHVHTGYSDFLAAGQSGAWVAFGMTTAWLNLGSNQLFQRCRWVNILGERYDEHELFVGIRSGFRTTNDTQSVLWLNEALETLTYENVKAHVAKQRGNSYQIEIQVLQAQAGDGTSDGDTNHAGAGFIGLALDIGFKANVSKLQQTAMR